MLKLSFRAAPESFEMPRIIQTEKSSQDAELRHEALSLHSHNMRKSQLAKVAPPQPSTNQHYQRTCSSVSSASREPLPPFIAFRVRLASLRTPRKAFSLPSLLALNTKRPMDPPRGSTAAPSLSTKPFVGVGMQHVYRR